MIEGTIRSFHGTWGSGIASLVLATDDGSVYALHCENGATVRALDRAFGNVIAPGHRVDVSAIIGKRIRVHMDSMGLLVEGFSVVEKKARRPRKAGRG